MKLARQILAHSFQCKEYTPLHMYSESPTCLSLPIHNIMSTQDVWLEALLNIRCIIILQQLMLLLLAISLFAKVQLFLWRSDHFPFFGVYRLTHGTNGFL